MLTHGIYCERWMYGTKCWYCGCPIYVLQCTCGSVVLFNHNRPPWDYHECRGGIGDSGLFGWAAIDQVRAAGMPVTPEVMEIVFGSEPQAENNRPAPTDTQKISPDSGETVDLMMNILEFHKETSQTKEVGALTEIARQMHGMPKHLANAVFSQITLQHMDGGVPKSYTAIIPANVIPSKIGEHVKNRSVAFVKLISLGAWWLVDEINIL